MVKAMVAAAKADGEIDDKERSNINQQMSELRLDVDFAYFIERKLEKPLDAKGVATIN